jgi:Zn-dependent protease
MNSNIIKNRGKKILLERVFQGPVMHLINGSDPQVIAISFFSYFVVLFLCFPLHELAHATTAYKLGDTSQKWNGGLSPNPIDHIDLIGALVMLIFPIGWAKPVMTDTRSFKKPRRDTALVSLAGPLTNLILAFIFYIIFKIM